MPNPFNRAAAAGLATVRALAGDPVYFVRGDQATELAAAVKAETTFTTVDHAGQPVEIEGTAWLVAAAALTIDGGPTYPQRGDVILATGPHGQELRYEILDRPGVPPFAWSDRGRTTLRIASKLIADPAP